MSKTETIVKAIVFVMVGVFATAGVKQLIKEFWGSGNIHWTRE